MNIIKKYKARFEEYGEESSRNTFEGELNYESGKLFFTMLISLVAWLPYIPSDFKLHQFPALAVSIRLGLTVISACLIALKLTKRFRYYPGIMMKCMVTYLFLGTSIITATAGELAVAYVGGFGFILMISIFATFSLKFKILTTSFSFILFLLLGVLIGLDFSDNSIQYSFNDLFFVFLLSLLISYIMNNVKYKSWEQNQKFASKTRSAPDAEKLRTPMNAAIGKAELSLREDRLVAYLGIAFSLIVLSVGFSLRFFGTNNEKVTLPTAADYEYAAIAETKEIKIGFVSETYKDMFAEAIMPSLEKMGYRIQLVQYSDYIRPNFALAHNEIDLNMFQPYAYFNNFRFENDLALSAITEIPTADLKSESYVVVAARAKDLSKQFVRDIIYIIHSDNFRNAILDPIGKYYRFQRPHSFYHNAPFEFLRKNL